MDAATKQHLVELVAKLDEAIKGFGPEAAEQRTFKLKRQAEKAECWDLLMSLCGYTQNGSDRPVKLHQDDATHTRHITLESRLGKKDYWGGSFEAAIRSADAAGECME